MDQLIAEQEQVFLRRQPRSADSSRGRGHLAGGATSNWQIAQPQAVWLSHGAGSKIYDVDGTEYVDLHGGYGVSLVGHAHPAIVAAVSERVARGTHFAQPTEDAIVVAEELARRFGLPLWRFGNSGTEATMDAVHLTRALTGRDLIIKVEGCYHGHHDSVEVSVLPEADEVGPREHPIRCRRQHRHPAGDPRPGRRRPFNDADAVARVLDENPGRVAGDDRRAGDDERRHHPARRRLPRGRPRPAARRTARCWPSTRSRPASPPDPAAPPRCLGVTPDIICLAKALGGGLPVAAIGGTDEVMGDRRRPLRAGRHLQRQPAVDGRRPGHPARGAHA